jgi:hypothetical protein
VIKLRGEALEPSVSTPQEREEREGAPDGAVRHGRMPSGSSGKTHGTGKDVEAEMRDQEANPSSLPALPGDGEARQTRLELGEVVEWSA